MTFPGAKCEACDVLNVNSGLYNISVKVKEDTPPTDFRICKTCVDKIHDDIETVTKEKK